MTYRGSFESAVIRLYGHETDGTGLAELVEATIERGSGLDPECADFSPTATLYRGTLASLLADHVDYDSGLPVAEPSPAGAPVPLRIRVAVEDTNDAQDLTSRFVMFFEVRP